MESEREEQSTATTEEDGTADEDKDASSDHEENGARSDAQQQDKTPDAEQQDNAPSAQQHDGDDADQASGGAEDDGGAAEDDGDAAEGDGGAAEDDGGAAEDDGDDDREDESASSPAAAIDDVSSLPGEAVNDQDGRKIGQVKDIYAVGEDETPMWVTIESATGLGRTRDVFVPLARIKRQKDEIRVPYSYAHIHEAPEVESGDELSEEDDRALRVYFAIGLADQELVGSAQSYASQVPDEDEAARKVDASAAEGPVRELDDTPPAERAAEAYEKQKEKEGEEHRQGRDATADDVFEEDGAGGGKDGDDKSDDEKSEDEKSEDEPKDEEKDEPEGEEKDEPKDEEKDQPEGEEKDEPKDNEESNGEDKDSQEE